MDTIPDRDLEEFEFDKLTNERSNRAGTHTIYCERGSAKGKNQLFYCKACGKSTPSSGRAAFAKLFCAKASRPEDINLDQFKSTQEKARQDKTARSRIVPGTAKQGKLENAKSKWEDQKIIFLATTGRHRIDAAHAYGVTFKCLDCGFTRSWDKRKEFLAVTCDGDAQQRLVKADAKGVDAIRAAKASGANTAVAMKPSASGSGQRSSSASVKAAPAMKPSASKDGQRSSSASVKAAPRVAKKPAARRAGKKT